MGECIKPHTPPFGHPSPRGDSVEALLEGHLSRGDPEEARAQDPLWRGVARSAGVCWLRLVASTSVPTPKSPALPWSFPHQVPPRRTDWEAELLSVRWDGGGLRPAKIVSRSGSRRSETGATSAPVAQSKTARQIAKHDAIRSGIPASGIMFGPSLIALAGSGCVSMKRP
jgi:hypothetical protein